MNHRTDQLAAAREKLALTGKSSRELGQESLLKTFDWLYKWGFSSSGCIQNLLDRSSGGYAQKLSRKGWLVSTTTISGTPSHFYTLSRTGLEHAERHALALLPYPEIDPYRVKQQEIRHYLFAQNATVNALNSGAISDFETERMFQEGDRPGLKRPDFVWITNSGQRIGGEIELSAKWDRDLDTFIRGIVLALRSTDEQSAKFDRFIIASDSKAIVDRYRAAMSADAVYAVWKKNQRGHWEIEKRFNVPGWLIQKVDFHLI
jgi:hypothetical protein